MTSPDGVVVTERFRTLVGQTLGLRVDDDKLPMLAELLAARSRAAGRAPDAYLAYAARERAEHGALVQALGVPETYFMRNAGHFAALADIVRGRAAAGLRHLRLLSAGCATGEEAYSLGISLHRALGGLDGWDVEIHGFDLNPECVARARTAHYGEWSLRGTSADIRRAYFRRRGKQFEIIDEIKRLVRFEQRNLVAPDPDFWRDRAFDILFCRNVLMYLTPDATHDVVERFERSVAPGGFLFIGHAENLRGRSRDFDLCHTDDAFYYQRRASTASHNRVTEPEPAAASEPARWSSWELTPTPGEPSWIQAITQSSSRIEALARTHRAGRTEPTRPAAAAALAAARARQVHETVVAERFEEAIALLLGPSSDASRPGSREPAAAPSDLGPASPDGDVPDAPDGPDELLLLATLLVGRGDVGDARRVCERLLALDGLNAGAHYVMALCDAHEGALGAAREHVRSASYLDPDFAMPHLQHGLMARRAGDLALARRELALALMLMAREDAARIMLFGGGFSRQMLAALCRSELAACGGDA